MLAVSSLGLSACVVNDDSDGEFRASWDIIINGAEGDCVDVGADKFVIDATNVDTGEVFTDRFDCELFSGATFAVPPGDYDIEISLIDDHGIKLNEVDFILQKTLFDGESLNLGNFDFTFTFRQVRFFAQMGIGTNGNCVTIGAGGAGVDQEEIRLSDNPPTQCLSGFSITTSQGDGTTCSRMSCKDEDAQIVVNGLRDGSYTMQVLGYIGGSTCYISNAQAFTVNGQDIVFTAAIIATFDSNSCNTTKPQAPK
jgi:hypothetical protein